MASTMNADRAKRIVRESVRRMLSEATQPVGYRPDWLVSSDGSTSVFLTFSKSENLFYDVGEKDLVEWSGFRRACIVFLLGSDEKALVIPAKELRLKLAQADYLPSEEYGDYKLHIRARKSGFFFRELPDWSLTGYLNNFSPLLGP